MSTTSWVVLGVIVALVLWIIIIYNSVQIYRCVCANKGCS